MLVQYIIYYILNEINMANLYTLVTLNVCRARVSIILILLCNKYNNDHDKVKVKNKVNNFFKVD